jgi:NAD(P)-dependent dehydrogenase (short-subunit alcohol dehydrogenase family)
MYSASKSATMLYTDALRMELAQDGVAVSLVEPGDLKPGMLNAAKADGFDSNAYATGAFDIMRKEEAEGTDPRVVVKLWSGACGVRVPRGGTSWVPTRGSWRCSPGCAVTR